MATSGRSRLLAGCISFTVLLSACSDSSPPDGAIGGGGTTGGGTTSGGTSGSSVPGTAADLFLNVMPPGANGNSAGGVGAPVPGVPVLHYPANFSDQLSLYGDLAYAQQGLTTTPCTPPNNIGQHAAASNQACNYYKSEGLDPVPGTVVSTLALTAPNGGKVTIQRDQWGVPYINGDDRAAAMYAFGYVSAQDRLWLHDVLRNIGRGRFSEFLGPAADTFSFDGNLAVVAGYDEDELTAMVELTRTRLGTLGDQAVSDLDNMVAGINSYIDSLTGPNLAKIPPEYVSLRLPALSSTLSLPFPPKHWTRNDIVASAILIQSIFATGGGTEPTAELLLQRLDPSFGPGAGAVPKAACEFWRDVRHANDPDATRTIETVFATQSPGSVSEACPQALPAGTAIWDVGSVKARAVLTSGGAALPNPGLPGTTVRAPLSPGLAGPVIFSLTGLFGPVRSLLSQADTSLPAVIVPFRRSLPKAGTVFASLSPVRGAHDALAAAGLPLPNTLSNFIAVTGNQTQSGRPIAVMGPQTSYFVPQLLSEVSIKSNGGTPLDFAGRGIVFADLPYIEIGRGIDFAWSATSGESDLIDTRVSRMCNLDGSTPSRDDANGDGFPDADGYLFDAQDGKGPLCRKFLRRTDTWTAYPTVASIALGGPKLPQTVTRYVLRTHYGPVFATATVNGAPVAISQQRSTFFDELGTLAPFSLASTRVIHDATSFQQVFNGVTGTFNWLYIDRDHLGYIHSGLYPQRSAGAHPELPVWGDGRYEWASGNNLPADFFTQFESGQPFSTSRSIPVARGSGNPLDGYFEWPGYLDLASHPTAIDPAKGYITSWNNSPARGWWAADFNGTYGPTHRVDMLGDRLAAFQATGRKFDFANMVEIMGDAAYTDLRGQAVLPLLLQVMRAGTLTAEQTQVADLMDSWLTAQGSRQWIGGTGYGFGAMRRDRNDDGVYDERQQVVLMDAWYPYLIDTVLPQLVAQDGYVGQGRYDAPRAQGSAYQEGWYEHMRRVLQMALNAPGHTDYRALRCANSSDFNTCRQAVLTALDSALARLGGFANRASWDGTTLSTYSANSSDPAAGKTVETYDAVNHVDLSLLPVPAIHWLNRPTFQQVVEIQNRR